MFICLLLDLENAQTTERIPENTGAEDKSPKSTTPEPKETTTTATESDKETITTTESKEETTTESKKETTTESKKETTTESKEETTTTTATTTTTDSKKETTTESKEDLDSARNKPKPRVIKLKIDKRLTISDLKKRLEPDIGISTDYFKIIRVYSNLQEFEYTRLGDTLSSFVDDVKVSLLSVYVLQYNCWFLLSVCMFVCLFVYSCVCLFTCMFVCLFTRLFIDCSSFGSCPQTRRVQS